MSNIEERIAAEIKVDMRTATTSTSNNYDAYANKRAKHYLSLPVGNSTLKEIIEKYEQENKESYCTPYWKEH